MSDFVPRTLPKRKRGQYEWMTPPNVAFTATASRGGASAGFVPPALVAHIGTLRDGKMKISQAFPPAPPDAEKEGYIIKGGLRMSDPPRPKHRSHPQYFRFLGKVEDHPQDGVYNAGYRVKTVITDEKFAYIFRNPGSKPPTIIADYWNDVLTRLDANNHRPLRHVETDEYMTRDPYRIREGPRNISRDIFAAGDATIKSNHRHHLTDDVEFIEALALQNDQAEISIRRLINEGAVGDVTSKHLPFIYFAGVLNDRNLLVLERFQGTSLSRIIPKLDQRQLAGIRDNLRQVITTLASVQSPHKPANLDSTFKLFHTDLQPHNILIAFAGPPVMREGKVSRPISFTLNENQDIRSLQPKIWSIIDWKDVGWSRLSEVREKHRALFYQAELLERLTLTAECSDELIKRKIWFDLYENLSLPEGDLDGSPTTGVQTAGDLDASGL